MVLFCLWLFSRLLVLSFSVVAKRLAWKSVPKITYLVLNGTLSLNSVNQWLLVTVIVGREPAHVELCSVPGESVIAQRKG